MVPGMEARPVDTRCLVSDATRGEPGTEISRRGALGALFGALVLGACRIPASERSAAPIDMAPTRRLLATAVAQGFMPGAVGLVARDDQVGLAVVGSHSFGGSPMRRDTIFRIASMTKPITAAAVMMLVDGGQLRLDEPIDRLLPELANRRVLRTLSGSIDDTVPADRPIIVEDLLTFRLGWGMIMPPGSTPIQRRIAELDIVGFGPPDPMASHTPDQWMERLGRLPLFAQPGTRWMYTTGANIAGVLVARASRMTFGEFLADRIFTPLGMKDTGFVVPPGKRERFATAYRFVDGRPTVLDDPLDGGWNRSPAFEAGDSGLVSTADDYLAFVRLLLAGGEAKGRRLLSREAVAAMTKNQLTPSQRQGTGILQPGQGWGYGMAVVADPVEGQPRPASFGWEGGYGSTWFTDPGQRLSAILLTQHEFEGPAPAPLFQRFNQLAYAV